MRARFLLRLKARFHLNASADGDPAGPMLSKFFRVSRSAKIQRSRRNSPWILPAVVRDECLLNTTAGEFLTILLVLSSGASSSNEPPWPRSCPLRATLIPLQLPLNFFLDDGEVNNEIGFPWNAEALNLDVATLTTSCYSNVPSLGREPR